MPPFKCHVNRMLLRDPVRDGLRSFGEGSEEAGPWRGLVGAAGEGRFGLAAAERLATRARPRSDFEVDVIDLATAWLPDLMTADPAVPRPSAVRDLSPWLAAADAFAVVTQEYRFGFPAALENAIDWYDSERHAKPVGFVCYGGPSGGLSGGLWAVARLRQVFAESHTVTVPETVSFANRQERWGCEGQFLGTEDWAHTRLTVAVTGPRPGARAAQPPPGTDRDDPAAGVRLSRSARRGVSRDLALEAVGRALRTGSPAGRAA